MLGMGCWVKVRGSRVAAVKGSRVVFLALLLGNRSSPLPSPPQQRHHRPAAPLCCLPETLLEKPGLHQSQTSQTLGSLPVPHSRFGAGLWPVPASVPAQTQQPGLPRTVPPRRRSGSVGGAGAAPGGAGRAGPGQAGPGRAGGGGGWNATGRGSHFPRPRCSCRDEREERGRGGGVSQGSGRVPGKGILGLGFPRRYTRRCYSNSGFFLVFFFFLISFFLIFF